jgi:hypothetical protein
MLTVDQVEGGKESIPGRFHLASDDLLLRSMAQETRKKAAGMEIQNGDLGSRLERAPQ